MIDTMPVRLLRSTKGATGIINVADFDPREHAPLDDTPPPTTDHALPTAADVSVPVDDALQAAHGVPGAPPLPPRDDDPPMHGARSVRRR
jgi:hypothetical protein